MKCIKTVTVKLSELKSNLFVREALDQEHVLFLASLYEGGTTFEPIEVSEDFVIVDGRHRREVYDLMLVAEVSVKILRFESQLEMIAYAYKANSGGPKPPTPSDLDHTIELMLELGANQKTIAEELSLPLKMVRKYIESVKSRLTRAKLMRAANSVINGGLSVAKAAEQYGADLDKLKEYLSGKKKKHKSNGIEDLQRQQTFNYKSLSSKLAALFRKLTAQYDDGDVTDAQIKEILSHLKDLQRKNARVVADAEARFTAKFASAKSAQSADVA